MSRRLSLSVLAVIAVCGSAPDARAQEPATMRAIEPTVAFAASTAVPAAVLPDREPIGAVNPVSNRSQTMLWLYAATAAMQAADIHSTRTALSTGAAEGNPVMRGVAGHTPAFIAVKAAVATGTILAAHQMSRHHKVAAIATLVAINSAYAMIVKHNYDVARQSAAR